MADSTKYLFFSLVTFKLSLQTKLFSLSLK